MDTGEPFESEIGGRENTADQSVLRRRHLAEPASTPAQPHNAIGPTDHNAQPVSSPAECAICCFSENASSSTPHASA